MARARAVGGRLSSGDRVDVLAVDHDSGQAGYVLTDAEVVAVESESWGALSGASDDVTITLVVDPTSAPQLAAAVDAGHGDARPFHRCAGRERPRRVRATEARMREPEIALAFTADFWVEELHRHLTDHGGARVRTLLVEPEGALEESYDVLVVGSSLARADRVRSSPTCTRTAGPSSACTIGRRPRAATT